MKKNNETLVQYRKRMAAKANGRKKTKIRRNAEGQERLNRYNWRKILLRKFS